MKTLFQKEVVEEIYGRINKLTPQTQKVWGKMNVEQMLAHCSVGIKSASGELVLQSPIFLRLIGSMLKFQTTNEKPFSKGSPTHQKFIIGSTEGFEKEKQILFALIQKFHDGGEAKCTSNPHAFFSKLTPTRWGSLMYKHIDHHLRQFGI
ncbi:MAG: DUF1569 domain-containing protein [Bacteroidota bacterium]